MLNVQVLDKMTTLLPPPPSVRQLPTLIDQYYNKAPLVQLYKAVLQPFFQQHRARHADLRDNARKDVFVSMMADLYVDRSLFRALLGTLPSHVQRSFELFTWFGARSLGKLERDVGHTLVEPPENRSPYGSYYYSYSDRLPLPPVYNFFQVDRGYHYRSPRRWLIGLAPELRALFQQVLPPPDAATLHPAAPPDRRRVYRVEETAPTDLLRYDLFVRDGHLDYGKTGRPLKKSIRQMAQYCEVPEFFEDSTGPLSHLATSLLVDTLTAYAPAQPLEDGLALLTTLLDGYFGDQELSLGDLFLSHLKGRSAAYDAYWDRQTRLSLLTLLTQMPPHVWIDVDHLHDYALAHNLIIRPYSDAEASRLRVDTVVDPLIDTDPDDVYSYYYDQNTLRPDFHEYALSHPLLRGHLALMAVLGLVDVAYDDPVNTILRNASYEFLSPFDGLSLVRLNALGAYLTGQAPTYDVAQAEDRPDVTVTLDDTYLIITLSGDDKIKAMIADQLAEQIGPLRYHVTYASFLRGCATREDVDEQIRRFRTYLAEDVPPHWDHFFADVRQKVDPLKLERHKLVFKLDGGPELIALMARDEILRQYILKADGYHIIVDEQHVNRIRRRLETFGYLMQRS